MSVSRVAVVRAMVVAVVARTAEGVDRGLRLRFGGLPLLWRYMRQSIVVKSLLVVAAIAAIGGAVPIPQAVGESNCLGCQELSP
jgi:hypothetical protein